MGVEDRGWRVDGGWIVGSSGWIVEGRGEGRVL